MKPTLLILAAGLGTRYGGLKQIDPIGPNGEIIIDYSIYDAINAGFGKLVFVIRQYFESAFKKKIGSKLACRRPGFDNLVETAYVYQEVDAIRRSSPVPRAPCDERRFKPWGTGHAILVAGDVIHEPFAVINADDYYGPNSFKTMAQFLAKKDLSGNDYAMVGYTLRDTLSEYGPVSRGLCQCDEQMFLRRVTECRNIESTATGARYFEDDGTERFLSGNEITSRNLWGFQPSIFHHLKEHFRRFLKERGDEKNSELFIPTVVDELVGKEKATVKVLRTNDKCFGVTCRRDAAKAARCIRQLIDQGLYPENLWEQLRNPVRNSRRCKSMGQKAKISNGVKRDIKSIVKHFRICGELTEIRPLPRGHINDTYVLTTKKNPDKIGVRYILQRINHTVFKDPPSVMGNIVRVTEHIRSRMQRIDPGLASRQLTVIASVDDACFHKDSEGNFWRVYNFIEDAVAYDTIESAELAYEAARMFGWFQKMLVDLPGPALHESICDFHNTPKRFETFGAVLKEDTCNRAKNAKPEINFLFDNAAICDVLLNLAGKGKIPIRVTHNDTKVNNVMLDKNTNKGVCVIDLDTVMPGLSIYDFGDMIRTGTTFADEDERNLSKVDVNLPMFEVFVRGFAEQSRHFLTSTEKGHLAFAAKLITFEQFIRFLTDYLAGDVYYKVHREGHNLDRSRTQMKLVQSIIKQEGAMNEVIERVFQQVD